MRERERERKSSSAARAPRPSRFTPVVTACVHWWLNIVHMCVRMHPPFRSSVRSLARSRAMHIRRAEMHRRTAPRVHTVTHLGLSCRTHAGTHRHTHARKMRHARESTRAYTTNVDRVSSPRNASLASPLTPKSYAKRREREKRTHSITHRVLYFPYPPAARFARRAIPARRYARLIAGADDALAFRTGRSRDDDGTCVRYGTRARRTYHVCASSSRQARCV